MYMIPPLISKNETQESHKSIVFPVHCNIGQQIIIALVNEEVMGSKIYCIVCAQLFLVCAQLACGCICAAKVYLCIKISKRA